MSFTQILEFTLLMAGGKDRLYLLRYIPKILWIHT